MTVIAIDRKRLMQALLRAGMDQGTLSENAGINRAHLSEIKKRGTARIDTVKKIEQALGCGYLWLTGQSNKKGE